MNQRYIVALEFSGSQVKGILASSSPSPFQPLPIPTMEVVVHDDKSTCVQYGRVQNIIDAAKVATFVKQRIENDPKMQGGHITGVYVGLAGRSLGSMATSAELTLPAEQEITEDILRRLYVEATKPVPADKKVLKVLSRKYVIDNQANPNPVGTMGTRIRGEFTVVTCNPANQRNLELVLADRLGLKVKEYVVTPLAMADLLLGEEEKQLGCVLVDVGAQTTTVLIYKDRALQYVATLPLGSYNITRDIASGLNLTLERAEQVKIQQGNALVDTMQGSDEENRLNSYVQARAGEIVANIVAQIGFAGFKPADMVGGFILTGRGSKLANFDKVLEAQSKMKVRRASIPATVNMADSSINPTDYASLIAIANHGAAVCDVAGCVQMPEPQTVQPQTPDDTAQGHNDAFDDGDDDYWNIDSDLERKAREQDAIRRKREEEKDLERKRKEESDKEDARKKKEEREKKKDNGDGPLKRVKKMLEEFFSSSDDDDEQLS